MLLIHDDGKSKHNNPIKDLVLLPRGGVGMAVDVS